MEGKPELAEGRPVKEGGHRKNRQVIYGAMAWFLGEKVNFVDSVA